MKTFTFISLLFITSVSIAKEGNARRSIESNESSLPINQEQEEKIREKKRVTKIIQIDKFSMINLMVGANVIINQGKTQKIVVTAPSKVIKKIDTRIVASQWNIQYTSKKIKLNSPIDIVITVPSLKGVTISGSGNIKIDDFEDVKLLNISIPGNGDILLGKFSNCERINIDISGYGSIKTSNVIENIKNLSIKITGSGTCDCFNIHSLNADAQITGLGKINIFASETLDAQISGSGEILYRGNAKLGKIKVSGIGEVIKDE